MNTKSKRLPRAPKIIEPEIVPPVENPSWRFLFAAWVVALIASLGALFIGEVMGQAPCVLCWYQRVFMFPLAIILAIASYRADSSAWRYALPLAIGGWLSAAFHTLLYLKIVPEAITPCGQGPSCSSATMAILGGVPLPVLSLAAFTAILALIEIVRRRSAR